jgi:flagellar basal-body rod protein FlgC
MADLTDTLFISAAGMKTQGERLRILAENVANADSLAKEPGGEPYRRKIITFENVMNRELGINEVRVDRIERDMSDFGRKYRPGHPAADEDGYILTPNVKPLIEMADVKEAQRSYEANLKVIEASRTMVNGVIGLLR